MSIRKPRTVKNKLTMKSKKTKSKKRLFKRKIVVGGFDQISKTPGVPLYPTEQNRTLSDLNPVGDGSSSARNGVPLELTQTIQDAVAEYFPAFQFRVNTESTLMYEYNGINYPLYEICASEPNPKHDNDNSTENPSCITFWAFDGKIEIYTINRCVSSISTKTNIRTFIDMIKHIHSPKFTQISIGEDASYLWFRCPPTPPDHIGVVQTSLHREKISLTWLYLLQYGQTYYNSFGFGRQSDEWLQFIQQPIYSWLTSLGFYESSLAKSPEFIDHVHSIPTDDTTSIQDYFKYVMNRLRTTDYCVNAFVYFVSRLVRFIKYNSKKHSVPPINEDLTLLL
jgi:hypothetical protein